MTYFDIVENKEQENITPAQKKAIEKRGYFNSRLIKSCDYEKLVKIVVDDSGNEYPCITPLTLKYFFGISVLHSFTALLHYKVYTVKFMGKVYRVKGADQAQIKENIKRCAASKEKKKVSYSNWISKSGNRERKGSSMKEWKIKNKEHVRKYNNDYSKKRRSVDEGFKLRTNLRTRIRQALKMNQKSAGLKELIGCSIADLKIYLESLWLEGMSWDNYGAVNGEKHAGWQVDHIIPCSLFDLSNPEDQKKCFHYSNLQPMWGIENIKKGNRLI